MNTSETMNSIKMVVRVAVISVMFLVLECSAANRSPSVRELLDKYTQALDSTQSFISSWKYSGVGSSNIPSWGIRVNNGKTFEEGEHRTDNKGRSYVKSFRWGHVSGSIVSRDKAVYVLSVVGSAFTYRHNKHLGAPPHRSHLTYMEEGKAGWDTGYRKSWGYFDRNGKNNLFMGYVQTKARLDRILKKARRISVRREPERIRGSLCYVIEADTRRGEFKVWLDSEHGYHPAKMEAFVGLGDDIGDPVSPRIITKADGITRQYAISNVRFAKVDGVWVPMEADSRSHVVLGSENGFSSGRGHFKRLKIVLNPDHDALGSFEDPSKNPELDSELQDGTVLYSGDGTKGTWSSEEAAAEADDSGM